ncbi:hypothetical protein [Azospirillum himalayense]|uniref:Uncharacterized protein n=1 Tax=Azospirillum himalayense TaxID=654847 RepID=A0ABW0FYR6_9PROT
MAATPIANFRQQIALVKQATISPEAFRKIHAETAMKAIADLEARQGVYPRTTVVDGRRDADEGSVRYGGVIEYDISPIGDVLDAIFEELLRASPVGPGKDGHYKDAHHLYIDGVRHEVGQGGQPIEVQPGQTAIFLNSKPYARKIEGGIKSRAGEKTERRPGLSAQAPNGVYEITARAMKRRFSNYPVKISFDYRGFVGGEFIGGKAGNKSRDRWPCIVVEVD